MSDIDMNVLVRRMIDGHILYSEAVTEVKRAYIQTVLWENMGNKNRTARSLQMHRNTLSRNLVELGIKVKPRPSQTAAQGNNLIRRIG